MFDIGASEFLLIIIVAVVVIGPKDLPRAMRLAGQWIAKIRRISGHFRSGIETMIREAELADMEEKWRKQNEDIMKAHTDVPAAPAEAALPAPSPDTESASDTETETEQKHAEPQLPLPPP